MKRLQMIQQIVETGIVAVIRAETKKEGLKLVKAITEGGVKAIEVTMTVPGAVKIIEELSETYDDIILGAGTVLDPETARACILAGAKYIVSPNLNPEVVKLCNRYRVPVMTGVMTVNEAIEAMELGVEIVKLFPGSAFGPSIVKAFKGPLPQVNIMPTGGVNIDNVKEWILKGCVAVGVGGGLTKPAKKGNYEEVTKRAKEFIKKVEEARREK